MEHDMLGQTGTSVGQNGAGMRGTMVYFNKHMRM